MREAPISVLVVDDNAGFRRVARSVLEEAPPGFVVHAVASGTQAVDVLERRCEGPGIEEPAFVVLDYHLPDMDAPAVLRRMARDARLAAIPVLVVSQSDWEEDQARALAAGARGFRIKPSRVHELRDVVLAFWKECVDANVDPADRRPS
jgi:CheY-like chemotaxis protein